MKSRAVAVLVIAILASCVGLAKSDPKEYEQGKVVDAQYDVAPENSPTLSIPLL